MGKPGDVEDFSDFAHGGNVPFACENEADAVPQFNGLLLFRQAGSQRPAARGDIRQNGKRGGLGGHAYSTVGDQAIRLLIVLIRSSSLTGLTR